MSTRKKRSPRLDIKNLDNKLCRYPSISRTGDSNRIGNHNVYFSDTDTFFYLNSDNPVSLNQIISLPTTLPSGSNYLNSFLSSSLFVIGNSIKDNELWIIPTLQYDSIKPFFEDKLFEQDIKDDVFYTTGSSLADFGDGFISNIGSKTKISINIPIKNQTQLQQSSASIYYLNSNLGRFEEIATEIRHRPYPNINFWETRLFNPLGNNIVSSSVNNTLNLGHIPYSPSEVQSKKTSYLCDGTVDGVNVYDNTGRLLSLVVTQSLLMDSRFEATSSQCIKMSNYIAHPFLVEKIIFEFPMKAGSGWLSDYTRFARLYASNGYRSDPFDAGGPAITVGILNQLNKSNRELILSATIIPDNDNFMSTLATPKYSERFSSGFLSFGKPAHVVHSGTNNSFTGTIRLSLTPRISNGITSIGFYTPTGSYPTNNGNDFRNSFALSVNPFGRGMRGIQSGRSIFGKEYATPITNPASTLYNNNSPVGSNDVFIYNFENGNDSPYLLLPQDKLVFSISKYRSSVDDNSINNSPAYNFNTPFPLNKYHDVWINTGSVNIILYGSLVKENKEYHDTLNSRLDTNSVHEIIHEKTLDEWDIFGIQEHTSSYITSYMQGTTTNYGSGSWTRRKFADASNFDPKNTFYSSNLASEQSVQYWEKIQFFKNTQFSCENENYYDAMIPRFDQLFQVENTISPWNITVGSGDMIITVDFSDSISDGYSVIDWTRSFPFEPKYSNIIRTKYIDKVISRYNPHANPNTKLNNISNVDFKIAIEIIPPNSSYTIWGDYENGQFTGLKYEDIIKILYGSGDYNTIRLGSLSGEVVNGFYGSTCRPYYRKNVTVSPVTSGSTPDYGYSGRTFRGSIIRGWKYGLMNGFEMSTKTIFRRDKFGQFRDMLEQRLDTKFYNGDTVLSSPIKVQFVTSKGNTVNPQNTFSSNLSFEASSSLPYFDGIVRNRESPIYTPSIYSTRFTK